jgi:hypothetical protein
VFMFLGLGRGGGGESETNCLKVIRGIFSTHMSKGAKVFLFCCCLYSKLTLLKTRNGVFSCHYVYNNPCSRRRTEQRCGLSLRP